MVILLPAPVLLCLWHRARGQGSPQGVVKVKGLSLSEGSWSHHSDPTVHTLCPAEFFSSPTFSNPSKWLRQKLLTEARETNCGVLSSKPSAGDFTLKRFPFTHCPFHQSEGTPESKHPEQLPSDPASGCWFILFGCLRVKGAAF